MIYKVAGLTTSLTYRIVELQHCVLTQAFRDPVYLDKEGQSDDLQGGWAESFSNLQNCGVTQQVAGLTPTIAYSIVFLHSYFAIPFI